MKEDGTWALISDRQKPRTPTQVILVQSLLAIRRFQLPLTIRIPDYKILAGYQFNKTWAIEVGYVDLGKITADTTATGPAATYRQESEGKGWSLDGVGTLQMGEKTKLFAKLGAFRWDMDSRCVKLSGTGSCNAPTDRSASGTDLKYGVGFKYDFNKKVDLVVE